MYPTPGANESGANIRLQCALLRRFFLLLTIAFVALCNSRPQRESWRIRDSSRPSAVIALDIPDQFEARVLPRGIGELRLTTAFGTDAVAVICARDLDANSPPEHGVDVNQEERGLACAAANWPSVPTEKETWV